VSCDCNSDLQRFKTFGRRLPLRLLRLFKAFGNDKVHSAVRLDKWLFRDVVQCEIGLCCKGMGVSLMPALVSTSSASGLDQFPVVVCTQVHSDHQ
jgi:hypothetical protein